MTRLFDCLVQNRTKAVNIEAVIGSLLFYLPLPLFSLISRMLPSTQREPTPFVLGPLYCLALAICVCGLIFAGRTLNHSFCGADKQKQAFLTRRILLGGYHLLIFFVGPLVHTGLYNGLIDPFSRGLATSLVFLQAIYQCVLFHGLTVFHTAIFVTGLTAAAICVSSARIAFFINGELTAVMMATGCATAMLGCVLRIAVGRAQDRSKDCFHALPAAVYTIDCRGDVESANKQAAALVQQSEYPDARSLLCAAAINDKEDSILARCGTVERTLEGIAQLRFAHKKFRRPYEFVIFKYQQGDEEADDMVEAAGMVGETRRIAVMLKEMNKDKEWEDSLKAGLLCSLSHELCNPLNGLLPLLKLLPKTDQENSRIQEVVLCNAELLNSKIQDLLDFTKLETNEIEHELACFEVGKLFDELQSIFKYEAESKKNSLSFLTKAKDRLRIVSDRKRIKQILVKLVSNAIKYTTNGLIEVSAQAIPNSADVIFSVLDTGMGMTEEKRKSIFATLTRKQILFSRTWNTLRLVGMGLTMSQKICESLGSKLQAFPRPKRGTTFTFAIQNCRVVSAVFERASPVGNRKSNCTLAHKECGQLTFRAKIRKPSKDDDIRYLLSDQFLRRPRVPATAPTFVEGQVDDCDADVADELTVNASVPAQEPKTPTRMIISNCDVVRQAGMSHLKRSRIESSSLLMSIKMPRIMTEPGDSSRQPCPLMMDYKRKRQGMQVFQQKSLLGVEEEKLEPTKSVLIADDSEYNRFVLRMMLGKFGIKSVDAIDGEDAYEKVKASFASESTEHFSLILMDLDMPRLDGIETTRKIRNLEYQQRRDKELPIIAVTAFDKASIKTLCLEARMQDFLTKPLELSTLKTAVERYVN